MKFYFPPILIYSTANRITTENLDPRHLIPAPDGRISGTGRDTQNSPCIAESSAVETHPILNLQFSLRLCPLSFDVFLFISIMFSEDRVFFSFVTRGKGVGKSGSSPSPPPWGVGLSGYPPEAGFSFIFSDSIIRINNLTPKFTPKSGSSPKGWVQTLPLPQVLKKTSA